MSGFFRHQWRDHLRGCTDLPPGAVLIALELHSHMNDRGTCHPGHDDLMRHTHLKHSALTKWLACLRESQWIEVLERGKRGPAGQNRASVYRARIPEHACRLETPTPSSPLVDVPVPNLGENPIPTPAIVNQSHARGNGQPDQNHESGTGSVNQSHAVAELQPRTEKPVPRFAQTTTADVDPYTLEPSLNPPDEPAMQPLMSKEQIKADPRIQEPLDELEKLSDEWKKSRPHIEKLPLHMPCVAEALQAALKTERQKPGSIIGATRFTRKVAYRISVDQAHQGQRAAERQSVAEGPASLPVPQFREPEEVVAE